MLPVMILGPGNSGSSAVLDYLRGRGDAFDPLLGQEFRLIQERDGLSSLHRSLAMEYHPDDAMYAVIRFAKLAASLGAESKKFGIPPKLGYGFSRRIPAYDQAISRFLEEITECRIGTFPLQDLLRLSTIDWIRFMNGRFPKGKGVVTRKPIPVGEDQFMASARKLISTLFYDSVRPGQENAELLVFDQAGSFWSPISSTQYFGEPRKLILVSRDPCDVYASQRRKSKIEGSAEEFYRYYKAVMNRIMNAEWTDERVLHLTFEDFVLDHERQCDRICAHLGIKRYVKSAYNPGDSRKSIGQYKRLLSQSEIETIRQLPASWPTSLTDSSRLGNLNAA